MPQKENLIQTASYAFALEVIKTCNTVKRDHREYVLSKQLLRCGTSIGANVEEAIGAQSRPDFISKMSIAHKEARETTYWVRLLRDTGYLEDPLGLELQTEADRLRRILSAILKTSKENPK